MLTIVNAPLDGTCWKWTYSRKNEMRATVTTRRSSRLNALRQNDPWCSARPKVTTCIHKGQQRGIDWVTATKHGWIRIQHVYITNDVCTSILGWYINPAFAYWRLHQLECVYDFWQKVFFITRPLTNYSLLMWISQKYLRWVWNFRYTWWPCFLWAMPGNTNTASTWIITRS